MFAFSDVGPTRKVDVDEVVIDDAIAVIVDTIADLRCGLAGGLAEDCPIFAERNTTAAGTRLRTTFTYTREDIWAISIGIFVGFPVAVIVLSIANFSGWIHATFANFLIAAWVTFYFGFAFVDTRFALSKGRATRCVDVNGVVVDEAIAIIIDTVANFRGAIPT